MAAQLFFLHHKKMLGGVSTLAQKKKKKENLASPAESETSDVESEREAYMRKAIMKQMDS